ncbi:carboxymuconolactone decarboxylase family protein [Actinacidiphila acididurans]|uniref:Carboxymuconolactone decarboxylase family protein n=1 Tax=Actinacidiphila acididurans TaxID=2784346 RepID=A0ABS2TTI1_9ACTN|nr:carboxymuconolactone decarboxylase family protein [Actinacidiphila acididurans]MBM9506296.1 carboxymuconolactone decarboxylase family protein [Actinacidiphila acididurans]
MTGFAPLDPATATGQAADLLADVQKSLGTTPNLAKVMANSPALLKGYLALSGALADGALPVAVREQLAIATAEHNGCEYCLSAHTFLGATVAEVDADELELARDAKSSDPHAQALLDLSDVVARSHGRVDDGTLRAARDAGATDAEIGEVVGHLALNTLTNYFAIMAGIATDWPLVEPRRWV